MKYILLFYALIFILLNLFGSDNLDYGIPITTQNLEIIDREGYALGYDYTKKQSLWVQYRLTADEVTNINSRRSSEFKSDILLLNDSSTSHDYSHSGYDRGHLAPSADMLWNQDINQQCFYLSNISPQLPSFNRKIWKQLESRTREIALNDSSIFVITGPVFDNKCTNTIGKSRIAVPSGFYKIILSELSGKTQCYYLPHVANLTNELDEFIVSQDVLEKITSLKFLNNFTNSASKLGYK